MVRAQLGYFDQRYLRDDGNDVCWVDTGASRTVHPKTCQAHQRRLLTRKRAISYGPFAPALHRILRG
jgi:hypothetical protein